MKENINNIAEKMSRLNAVELSELSSVLLSKYNMSATIYHFGVVPTIENPNNNNKCDLVLLECGQRKLMIVKSIKEIFGLGLKEAKDIIDTVPTYLSKSISIVKAEKIKLVLEEIGAKVEINY